MPNLYSVIFTMLVASSSAFLAPQGVQLLEGPAPQGQILGASTDVTELSLKSEASASSALSLAEAPAFQASLGASQSAESTEVAEPTPAPQVKVAPPVPPVTPTASPAAVPQLAPHELDALFQKYGTEYGVSWEKLKVIAKCESGYRADAVGGGGLYGGMYQYVTSTWSGTRKAMGLDPNPELRFNAEEAIRTTAWKIAHGGLGAWPHCGQK